MVIKINGAAIIVHAEGFSITDAIEERSTCSFAIVDTAGTQVYKKGQKIEVYDGADRIFFGAIEKATVACFPPSTLKIHSIDCIDGVYATDKRIIAKAYENKFAGDIVRDIVDGVLSFEGITYSNKSIQLGPLVTEAVFNYINVTQVLNSLAEQAGFWWNIDADKVLHFVSRETYNAPWDATESDILIDSVSVEEGNPEYRNKQYIIGGKDITDTQTEHFKGDGAARTWSVGFPIAKVPSIKINGIDVPSSQIGIRGVSTNKAFYWNKGDKSISQDDGETILTEDDILEINYQGEFDIVLIASNQSAIDALRDIETEGTGIVEQVDHVPEVTNRMDGFQVAYKKVNRYCVIGKRIQYITTRKGLKPGQLQNITIQCYGLNKEQCLIESIEMTVEENLPKYKVTAVTGATNGSWAKMFHSMSKKGQAFILRENVSEDQILVTLSSFSKTWLQSESPNIFIELYPSDTLYPSNNLCPMFGIEDRVKYIELLDGSNNVILRKQRTSQAGGQSDRILTTWFINPTEGNGDIAKIQFFGGFGADSAEGSGVKIDEQVFVRTKTQYEGVQIDKTDIKDW